MKRLGIFGVSGFAREVADIAYELGFDPFFIAHKQEEADTWQFKEDVVMESSVEDYADAVFAIGIGDNITRELVAKRYKTSLAFTNLIHPSATFGYGQRERIDASRGVIVCAGARFTNNIEVGDFAIFNLNSTVGHDAVIENYVNIAPGVNISGNVHIKPRCWIGTGAAINQGSSGRKLIIGADTTVGSGSVVVKDCEVEAVYVGIPAKRIK